MLNEIISIVIILKNSLKIVFKSISYPSDLLTGPFEDHIDIIKFNIFKLFRLKYYLFT